MRFFTVFLVSLFVVGLVNVSLLAGDVNKNLRKQAVERQVVTDEMEAELRAKVEARRAEYDRSMQVHQQNVAKGTLADGDTIGFTVRDFTMNTCIGRKIAITPDGGIHTIFTSWATATDPYHENYNYYDPLFGFFFGDQQIDPALSTLNTRSGRVLTGPNGEAWVSFHDHSTAPAHRGRLYHDSGPGQYSFTGSEIAEGRFASADYKDGGATWFSTNDQDGNFEIDRLFKSTDGGNNWTQTGSFLYWPPDNQIGNVEVYPFFNSVTGDIEVFYQNSTTAASIDSSRLYWAKSSNLGDTWDFTTVYHEPTILSNNVYYLNDNFSQLLSEADVNGVTHLVFNGYGFMTDGTSPDSTLYVVFDVGYWNSTMSSFDEVVNLADSLISRNPPVTSYMNSNTVGSGNNIGNAFPGLALHPDGVIAVIWEQGELAPGDTTLVIGTNPAGTPDPAGIYAQDIWCAVSGDFGQTWSEPFYVHGSPSKCDRSPSIAKDIEKDANGNYWIHFVYMHDPIPGQQLPNPPEAPAAWVYGNYDITPMIPVGIGDINDKVVKGFTLSQNYPNPFNPTTTIEYSLNKAADVTLNVFNVTGQKVVTLVKERKAAGQYNVTFDAANFATGIYFYTLKVADATITKKMVLMK